MTIRAGCSSGELALARTALAGLVLAALNRLASAVSERFAFGLRVPDIAGEDGGEARGILLARLKVMPLARSSRPGFRGVSSSKTDRDSESARPARP